MGRETEHTMAEVRIKDIDEQEIDTILAEDIDFEGHLSFKKPLMIKGKFRGDIKASSSSTSARKPTSKPRLRRTSFPRRAGSRAISSATSRVELFSTAKVDGDITAPDFVAESGCKFNGYCNMSGEPARKDNAQRPQAQQHSQQQPQNQQQGQQQPQQQAQTQGQQQKARRMPTATRTSRGSPLRRADPISPLSSASPGAQSGHNPSHGGSSQK
ncbi:MAG: hypothetical protein MZV64_28615 [Ignavibacteriales bacterium]|nr:hypothetical protein [Ignavibacteriales bacterium]